MVEASGEERKQTVNKRARRAIYQPTRETRAHPTSPGKPTFFSDRYDLNLLLNIQNC